jgi:hypothetical protein
MGDIPLCLEWLSKLSGAFVADYCLLPSNSILLGEACKRLGIKATATICIMAFA